MRRTIVVAMTPPPEQLIGQAGGLPWRISEDLKHFKRVTLGHAIIMGRKTLEEIKTPLPGRRNLVVTRNPNPPAIPGVEWFGSLQAALSAAEKAGETDAMICGGAEIYRQTLAQNLVDRMVITFVELTPAPTGDRYFPAYNAIAWRETERRTTQDGPAKLTFVTLERTKSHFPLVTPPCR